MLIYFDHSATTPLDKKVLNKMFPFFGEKFGNASSIHSFGKDAIMAVDEARDGVSNFLNCNANEIIFTSGATESDNLAITGLINALQGQNPQKKIHIITSSIEHPAVFAPCAELERRGVEVTYLPVDKKGTVKIEDFKNAIKDDTFLVSIMYVNSEIGSIQPIREIGKIIKKINEKKINDWKKKSPKERGLKPQKIYFHTDAVQAVNFLNCDTKFLHVDLLSLSGHKIYGPKGIGVLFIKQGTPIKPLFFGGHHERGIRSGTLNVPGIVGLAKALKLVKKNQERNNKKIENLRNMMIEGIQKKVPQAILNTDIKNSVPSHAHFSFLGAEGESILISLDLEGIAVSTGSACASGNLKASHVLLAMGIAEEIAHNSIRFTLGKNNKKEEVQKLINTLPPILKRLRKMAPKI